MLPFQFYRKFNISTYKTSTPDDIKNQHIFFEHHSTRTPATEKYLPTTKKSANWIRFGRLHAMQMMHFPELKPS